MSIHIGAKDGEIAEAVLMPGDPLRAKYVAETFLEDAVCYNEVRGMYGFTGTYQGKRVSVQGSGMGQPSLAIYATELIRSYGVKKLIRIGSCGSYQEGVKVRDIVLAMSASTDSNMNRIRFGGLDFAPCADYGLFASAVKAAENLGINFHAGNVLSADSFYAAEPDVWKLWASYGVLAVEMETSALYTIAAKEGAQALGILTVSDSLVTGEETTSEERQNTFKEMMKIALEAI